MPIGIVSDADFLSEITSLRSGKTDGAKSTPVSIPAQEINVPSSDSRGGTQPIITNDDKKQESALPATYPPPTHLTIVPPATKSTKPGGVLITDIPKRGRKEGDVNVPDSLRKLIAETALMDGRDAALQLAKDFGISASSVSAYTNGATSTTTYDTPKPTIIGHINRAKERAIKRASRTLNGALSAISQDKLDNTDAKDLAGIARDMSVLIKNLEPSKEGPDGDGKGGPQFMIFAPQFRDERSFESIVVNE